MLNLPSLGPRRSVRVQVAHALRAAIVSGEMRPGVVYSAPALAERFGVSATPVREAMIDLAREGLVEAVRNKGFRVTELSDRDLDEITEVRALIEIPTVVRVAETCRIEDVDALRPLAEAIVTAAGQRDVLAYIDADHRFHLAVLELSGNAHIVRLVSELRYRSRLYGVPRLAERGELEPSAREHEQLLNAMADGDAAATEALMHHHLRHIRGIWADRPEHR
ncbi:GntR family transcriptional regulator [Actinomadura bangladeshensis]|uniref:GntR family transcriptional regulator n=1 Tax=Actinomadura bangladeshensis TaxID=453573 RepID=A0A6L9QXG4_9ACTN|nr:GntR family transcriptional regulator [Actinomadura bangladeshensis]NEA29818.1 GntR family transcriptional regulator [Actinomadura bangladeshensis]